jgi:hypothetical protein
MFVGQASAMGMTLNIPTLIRSLAESFFYPPSISLCLDLGRHLMLASSAVLDEDIDTHLVEVYSHNWWDNNIVRFPKPLGGDYFEYFTDA